MSGDPSPLFPPGDAYLLRAIRYNSRPAANNIGVPIIAAGAKKNL
jgi:hypothetical protein